MKSDSYSVIIMLLCVVITAAALSQFAKLIQHLLSVRYDWKFELSMVLGQLAFQFSFIYKKTNEQKISYYFNMLLVSLIGSVLLLPLLIINYFYSLNSLSNILYFFAVVLIMFFEHRRRVKKLEFPSYISYTWVLYRLLILIFILI